MRTKFIYPFILLLMVSCSDFEKLNVNPNQPTQAIPNLILTNVISNVLSQTAEEGFNSGNILAQLTSKFQFGQIDRYNIGTNSDLWNVYYQSLSELNTILEYALDTKTRNKGYEMVVLVLRSYIYENITDIWGNVPYTDAIKGKDEIFTPKYTSQEEIYNGILADLKKASEVLFDEATRDAASNSSKNIRGDVMYNNSLEQWRKLANSPG